MPTTRQPPHTYTHPTTHPGTPLETNLHLHLLEWHATYIPGSQLDAIGGFFSAAGEGVALLPDSGSLLAGGSSSGGADEAAPPAVEELRRVLRGQDLSQLRAYVGMLPPAASSSSGDSGSSESIAAGEAAAAEEAASGGTLAAGVLRCYEPEASELVVLLACRISGKPATGAELLVAVRREDGSTVLELPDGWEEALNSH